MPDPLTTELENAVEKGLASGQNYLGHQQQRMTGGARNGAVSATQAQGQPTMTSSLEMVQERNAVLKAELDHLIEGLQRLRGEL